VATRYLSLWTCVAQHRGVFQQPNDFRRVIYVEAVDRVLRRHEHSMRLVFNAAASAAYSERGLRARMLSHAEWMHMLRALELIAQDLTERDATLCFAWSRMQVDCSSCHKLSVSPSLSCSLSLVLSLARACALSRSL
jgi:hypothetical protein